LLFHKKFGKQAALQASRDSIVKAFGRSEYPPLQLLRTMASYVPVDTPFFHHALIPRDFGHVHLKAVRLSGCSSDLSTARIERDLHLAVFFVMSSWLLQFACL